MLLPFGGSLRDSSTSCHQATTPAKAGVQLGNVLSRLPLICHCAGGRRGGRRFCNGSLWRRTGSRPLHQGSHEGKGVPHKTRPTGSRPFGHVLVLCPRESEDPVLGSPLRGSTEVLEPSPAVEGHEYQPRPESQNAPRRFHAPSPNADPTSPPLYPHAGNGPAGAVTGGAARGASASHSDTATAAWRVPLPAASNTARRHRVVIAGKRTACQTSGAVA